MYRQRLWLNSGMVKACGVEGCDGQFYAKGWCRKHYRIHGVGQCKEPGCTRPADSRGWCTTHYERWRQHGDAGVVLGRRPLSDNPDEAWCVDCQGFKPISEFDTWLDTRFVKAVTRLQSSCKTCKRAARQLRKETELAADPVAYRAKEREANIRRLYGMSAAAFDELLASQDGMCANTACRKPHVEERGKRLCVDHDHRTGEVRGLLCNNCNRGMGLLGDDPERLIAAARYLLKWRDIQGQGL